MKMYVVGGAVRDALLGRPCHDRDIVVIGATPEQMLALGYQQVGADFPVFLHPETHEEYALGRTERKSGHGYGGFLVDTQNVTLEQDLARRDLTINAMAQALNPDGTVEPTVVDPYGGQRDLHDQVLRHVSPAFVEDPVRVLRLARFRARLPWQIAPETEALCREMIRSGELDYLTAERVYKEIEKGLREQYPELMIQTLLDFEVLDRPPFREYRGMMQSRLSALQAAVKAGASLPARFALAVPGRWAGETLKVSRVPAEMREVSHHLTGILESPFLESGMSASNRLEVLEGVDALRQHRRFAHIVEALSFVVPAAARQLRADWEILSQIDYGAIAAKVPDKKAIRQVIREARLEAISR